MTPALTTPGLLRRLASLVYESLLIGALLMLASAVFTPLIALAGDSSLMHHLLQLFMALVLFAYFGYCWVKSGQTPAMKPWRLQLQRADGSLLDWQHAAIRYLLALLLFVGLPALALQIWQFPLEARFSLTLVILSWWLVPLLWALVDPDRQFLHDRLSGTRISLTAAKKD